jgi:uncharacterized protein
MTPTLWWVIASSLIVIGVIGTFLPAIPGPAVVFAGMLLAAWIEHFSRVGWVALLVLGLLAIATVIVDVVAGILGARRVGASRRAVIGAAIGTVVGIFFGFVGLLIAPFIGAVIGELASRGQIAPAMRVGVGTWIGLLLGAVAKAAILLAMLLIFLLDYFLGGGAR